MNAKMRSVLLNQKDVDKNSTAYANRQLINSAELAKQSAQYMKKVKEMISALPHECEAYDRDQTLLNELTMSIFSLEKIEKSLNDNVDEMNWFIKKVTENDD